MFPNKEVHYKCSECKYEDKKEDECPCYECLARPVNLYSHTPINFKEKKKRKFFSRRIK